jgi:hypothetical protein
MTRGGNESEVADGLEFVGTTFSCTHTIGQQVRGTNVLHDSSGALGADRRGAISIQVLQEFYVNATRKIAEPLNHDVAVDRLRALRCCRCTFRREMTSSTRPNSRTGVRCPSGMS